MEDDHKSFIMFGLICIFLVFVVLSGLIAIVETPKAFAKQRLYKDKTGIEIGIFTAFGMPIEACMPSEPDKTYNLKLGTAK